MNPFTSYIIKRSRSLNSSALPTQNVRFESIKSMMDVNGSPEQVKKLVDSYIVGLMSVKEATKNYHKVLATLGYLEENNVDYSSTFSLFRDMLFFIESNSLAELDNWLNSISYSEDKKNIIREDIAYIGLVDRVVNNSNVLNKKFDFEKKIKALRYRGINDVIKEAVSILSEYKNMKNYQKMNVIIEQLTYISNKDNIQFSDNIPKDVMEYFILHTDEKRANIYKVIEESPLVTEQNIDEINECFKSVEGGEITDSITHLVNYLTLGNDKGEDAVHHMVFHTMMDTSITDIATNIKSLFVFFGKTFDKSKFNFLLTNVNAIAGAIGKREMTNTELGQVADALLTIDYVKIFDDKYIGDTVYGIIRDALVEKRGSIQSTENLKAIMSLESYTGEPVALEEFKKIKFTGIIKAVADLDNFLKGKEKIFLKKAKTKLAPIGKKLTSYLFGEASYMKENIFSYIGADNKVDVCVRQYMLEEYDNDLTDTLDSIIKEFNYQLDNAHLSNVRVYYTMTEDVAEIHLKDATNIQLTDEEYHKVLEAEDPSMDLYIDMVDESYNTMMNYIEMPIAETANLISYDTIRSCKAMTEEAFLALLEAAKCINVSKEQVLDIVSAYNDIVFERSIEDDLPPAELREADIVESWEGYDNVPTEIALEAYEIIYTIISESGSLVLEASNSTVYDHMKQNGYTWDEDEEEDKDNDDEDDEDDEEDKKPKKKEAKKPTKKPSAMYGDGEDLPKNDEKKKTSFNLNSAILAAKGLAGKIKQYSGKAKETINNLDYSMRSFINAMKKADSDERRERIIKGSIIPSFEKCIKFGVALVGLGIATGGVVAPIIAAIGGFALDKKLTKKEKLLILDEIDTEIEVIDKELAIADQNNQINKYRALLRYKKDLQRQYQRIRYNIRVGQDTAMFSSDVGMQKKD